MPSVSPLDIPEILHLILGCRSILTTDDLTQAALVCRAWASAARQALWQALELDGDTWLDPHYQRLISQLQIQGPHVRTLVLRDCGSDKSRLIKVLSMVKNIQSIQADRFVLHGPACTLLQSPELASFSRLRTLQLPFISSNVGGTDVLFQLCSAASRIQSLELMDSDISGETLAVIERACPQLRSLDLSRNEVITFNEVVTNHDDPKKSIPSTTSISSHGPLGTASLHRTPNLLEMQEPFMNLEDLTLTFCLGISSTEFQLLFRSFHGKSLRSLDLQFTNVDDSAIEVLVDALRVPPYGNLTGNEDRDTSIGLTSINLSFCSRITAQGIRALVEGCPLLLELEFLGCDLVSAECFQGAPWSCTRLRRLEFTINPSARPELSEISPVDRGILKDDTVNPVSMEKTPLIDGHESSLQHQSKTIPQQQLISQDKEKQQQQQEKEHEQLQQQSQQQFQSHRQSSNKDWDSSVQCDYHSMFKQLRRLSWLQELHIYNGSYSSRPGISEETLVQEASQTDTADCGFTSSCVQGDSTGVDLGQPVASTSMKETRVTSSDDLKTPLPLHPFSTRMGFKALQRLKNLTSLALYERSSMILDRATATTISQMFPQLSRLDLFGTIELSNRAKNTLARTIPTLQIHTYSMFE